MVARIALLRDGDTSGLGHGLAGNIGSEGGGLLVPLLADGADLPHAVVGTQFILGGLRGGEVGGNGPGGVKIHVGRYRVDDHAGDGVPA